MEVFVWVIKCDNLYQKYLSTNELVKAGKHELKPKLNRLKQQLSHHKMHQYMSKGLKSTIVEDTIILNTDHTYESAFEEAISQYTKYIPDVIKQGFKLLTLHPDTQTYQFLAQATQYSDFTAKYVLAEHLQEQGNSLDDAISQAQETFINFDVPTSRGLDYANKMGLFMFTKFFIRFQKVLQKQIKDNPVQVAIQSLLLHYGLDLPTVVEPAWLLNIDPIPVDGSLLIAPNALMDITPIDLATRVF